MIEITRTMVYAPDFGVNLFSRLPRPVSQRRRCLSVEVASDEQLAVSIVCDRRLQRIPRLRAFLSLFSGVRGATWWHVRGVQNKLGTVLQAAQWHAQHTPRV